MTWSKKFSYLTQYEYTNSNQHGDRFKRKTSKRISIARLEADYDNPTDLQTLILLSHNLDVPVHYDYKSNKAWIEVAGQEAIGV